MSRALIKSQNIYLIGTFFWLTIASASGFKVNTGFNKDQSKKDPITLGEAIHYALETHPMVEKAEIVLNNSELAAAAIFKAGFLPRVSVNASTGWIGTNEPRFGRWQGSMQEVNLNVSLSLFEGFKTWNEMKAGNEAVGRQLQNLIGQRLGIALQTSEAYIGVLASRQNYLIALDNYLKQKEIAEAVEKDKRMSDDERAFASGSAKAAYENKHNVVIALGRAIINYVQVVDQSPDDKHLEEPLPVQVPEDLETAVALAKKMNPSMLQAKHLVQEKQYQAQAARSTYYPHLTLFGSTGRNWIDNTIPLDFAGHTHTGGIRLSWDLFLGGRVDKVHEADGNALMAELDAKQLERNLRAQISTFFLRRAETENVLSALRTRIPDLENSVAALKQRIKTQPSVIRDLLRDMISLTSAQVELNNRRFEVYILELQILAITGQMFEQLNVE